MPLLGALVVLAFEKLFGAWADTFTRKAAIIAAAIGAIAALTAAFIAAMSAAVSAVVPVFPSGFALGVWLFVPSNAPVCVGIILTTDAAVAVFRWARSNIKLAAQVAG